MGPVVQMPLAILLSGALLIGHAVAQQVPLPPVKPGTAAPAAAPSPEIGDAVNAAEAPAPDLSVEPPAAPVPAHKPETPALPASAGDAPQPGPKPAPTIAADRVICKDPRLQGRVAENVIGPIRGCLIVDPVKVTRIAGIKLSSAATLDCRTARTFANWVTSVTDPAARQVLGARITEIWIMGTYSCRTRNSRPGARLSEHAVGRAVDVGGVTLGDGRKVTVKRDWGRGKSGQFLRRIWKQACGAFTTVLGPGADRFHQDHLHLDTAYRNRTYCR